MDVEKAFDKDWHNGLLYSLYSKNIPNIYLGFINSFLSNRCTYFSINNKPSPLIKINYGVPQGSALSPILFITYVADIPMPAAPTFISQFADAITTFSTSKHLPLLHKQLQVSMNQIAAFCGKSRISLNEKKNMDKYQNTPRKQLQHSNYKTKTFQPLNKQNSLVLHSTINLNFKAHINRTLAIAKTRAILLYSIYNQKYGPSPATMIRLFKIYVRPLFEYGSISTITATTTAIKPWETIQTNYIKYILNLPNISNKNTLKFAYLPKIIIRINTLASKWINNIIIIIIIHQ